MATKFGKWEIVEPLVEGGQSHTFLVREVGTNDSQANLRVLKRLKNQKRKDRFERELKACLALSHPNIIKIVAHDLENKDPYFVTEYYSGGSLRKAKDAIAALPLRRRLEIYLDICRAVAHAHENNPKIIHRDLKPDNIFLRAGNFDPVVGDFGICFLDDDGERLTLTEEAAGPRFYMAPELADGRAQDVGPPSDVYSLGKVLYWLASGGGIFDREEHRSSRYDLSKDPQDRNKSRQEPAYDLINFVLDKMIAKDPSFRFEDASVVVGQIQRLIRCIDLESHFIDIDAPQICIFCGMGLYEPVFDFQNMEIRRKAKDNSIYKTAIDRGFEVPPRTPLLVMVCNYCGNVQIFRPDLAQKRETWARKRG